MKKISLLLLVISLVSCQITERFYLHEDGSVREEREIDLSALIEMAGSMDAQSQLNSVSIDTIVDADSDIQSILPSEATEAMDSFEQLRKQMDKSKFHIVLNKDQYIVTIRSEAENIDELNAYNQKLNRIKADLEKDESNPAASIEALNFARYHLDGKNFERILLDPLIVVQGDGDADLEKSITDAFIYRLEYHFPKSIKSTSLEATDVSGDTQSVIFADQLSKILEYEDQYKNFSVTFQ